MTILCPQFVPRYRDIEPFTNLSLCVTSLCSPVLLYYLQYVLHLCNYIPSNDSLNCVVQPALFISTISSRAGAQSIHIQICCPRAIQFKVDSLGHRFMSFRISTAVVVLEYFPNWEFNSVMSRHLSVRDPR